MSLSAADVGALTRRARHMIERGKLSAHAYVLLDAMLWRARKPGAGETIVSYATLRRLTGQARSTIARGLAALERVGLLQRIRRRLRIAWGRGVASRQDASRYVFAPAPRTEFPAAPAYESQVLTLPASVQRAAAAQLAKIAERSADRVRQALLRGRRW